MKYLAFLVIAVLSGWHTLAAPQMITKGLDLTGQSSVTASQINQMVDNAVVTNSYGLVIRTNGRPTTAAFAGHTNFLWYDISVNPPSLKGYICCGDNDTNWVAATVGAGAIGSANLANPAVNLGQIFGSAIVTSNLANNAVTDVKISAGAINNSHLQSAIVSNANIALGTITGDRIATLTITDTNIAANTLTGGKFIDNTISPSKIAAGTPGYFLAVATGGTTPSYVNFFARWETNGLTVPTTSDAVTNAHNLGQVPSVIQVSLVCNSAELGYAVNDIVPVEGVIISGTDRPAFVVNANANNWYWVSSGASAFQVRTRTNPFAYFDITKGNWRLKANLYRFTAP